MIRPAIILAAAACLTAPIAAQSATARVHLAADPARRGPETLTWLRTSVLPKLVTWPSDIDPLDPLLVEFSREEIRVAIGGAAMPVGVYLRGRIEVGATTLNVTTDFDGAETWSGATTGGDQITDRLNDWLGLDTAGATMVVDLPVAVGNLAPAIVEGQPWSEVMTLGAAWCGNVTFRATTSDGQLRVEGRSAGGLLLPAAMCYVAAASQDPGSDVTETDTYTLLARSARDNRREEAIRQLAVCATSAADDALERLLGAEDFARTVAMDAMIKRGNPRTLEALISAATPEIEGTEALAETAVRRWLPRAPRAFQASVLGSLDHHRSPRLAALAGASPPPPPGEPTTAAGSWGTSRTYALIVACVAALALAATLVWRR